MKQRTEKSVRRHELPLLGSNQDSPDPESAVNRATPRADGVSPSGTVRDTAPTSTQFHENSHGIYSPEATGVYVCPACKNNERFTGIDEHGCPGPDECDGSCPYGAVSALRAFLQAAPLGSAWARRLLDANTALDRLAALAGDVCSCEAVLTQDFDVLAQDGTPNGADITYHAHTGGGYGAEIDGYTAIKCRDCGALLWAEPGALIL